MASILFAPLFKFLFWQAGRVVGAKGAMIQQLKLKSGAVQIRMQKDPTVRNLYMCLIFSLPLSSSIIPQLRFSPLLVSLVVSWLTSVALIFSWPHLGLLVRSLRNAVGLILGFHLPFLLARKPSTLLPRWPLLLLLASLGPFSLPRFLSRLGDCD